MFTIKFDTLGLIICLAPLIYGTCSAELKIPFPPQPEDLPGPAILNLALGASFWLVLATGKSKFILKGFFNENQGELIFN